MRIAVVGGGPAGLYFAILLKKARPAAEIVVHERNRPDDTFGFGVVFSDATLDTFERHDGPSYRRITEEFAYWDDIAVHFKGRVPTASRQRLLQAARAARFFSSSRDRGPRTRGEAPLRGRGRGRRAVRRIDLVVAAEGINSRFRTNTSTISSHRRDLRPNKFAWMGTDEVASTPSRSCSRIRSGAPSSPTR
jgi:anthraniloyl-CoA monooxygenase